MSKPALLLVGGGAFGFVEPVLLLRLVFGDAPAVLVHVAHLLLCALIALFSGFAKPLRGLSIVLREPPAVQVHVAQTVLADRQDSDPRTCETTLPLGRNHAAVLPSP